MPDSFLIFIAVILWLLFGLGLAKHIGLKKRCTVTVEARCVFSDTPDWTAHPTSDTQRYCSLAKWEYTYNGKVYQVEDEMASRVLAERVGAVQKMQINPELPQEYYSDDSILLILLAGLAAGAVTAYILLDYLAQFSPVPFYTILHSIY